ncbi:MAG: hypothetical protein ACOC93_03015 [Planctomycetota bacterium]
MLTIAYSGFGVQLATVVVPVAVYFLTLGLLNSRAHPQLLTGRQDFALLNLAICPVLLIPLMQYVHVAAVPAVLAGLGGVILVVHLFGGGPRSWVIYNLPLPEARRAVARALQQMDASAQADRGGYRLPAEDAYVQVGGFPLLRNASVRIVGGDPGLCRRFEQHLARTLDTVPAETHPTVVALLLVATAMLVAPVTLVAHRMPEMVRLLTDLMP